MLRIAIVGSGPAALMAATQLVSSPRSSSYQVHLFEKRAGLGRKLLIAGSSGLNISHEHSLHDFTQHYEGWTPGFWNQLLTSFAPKDWISFIETELKLETFLGTSQRYFVKEMKASTLLKHWTQFLEERGVIIHLQSELTDFKTGANGVSLSFNGDPSTVQTFSKAAFFLGGASWEDEEPKWAELFRIKKIKMIPFEASNVGYEVDWNEKFLTESEGKPLKKIELQTKRGKKMGELVVTSYGLEGTPIYFCGIKGQAFLDLKPDLSEKQILDKLSYTKENLSPIRRVKHLLALSEASESLLFHHSSVEEKNDLTKLVARIKKFPLLLKQARPLSESISSKGGVDLEELFPSFELKKYPGVYCGGEMLNWDSPTGGFLIQACVSQGAVIGRTVSC